MSKKFSTASNLPLKAVYGKQDLSLTELDNPDPGKYPYTRGIHADMYRGKLWTMRQYAGFGSAKEANERYRYLLQQGTSGLSMAFDLPTQMGRDSDHLRAQGEVGRVGVAISSLDDMHLLLDKIPLKDVSISMTINSTAATLLALLLVVADEHKVDWKDLRGTVQNDILKEYIARGTYIYPPKYGLKLVTDLFEFCAKEVPQWNSISISGYHIREAGSTAIEELAFTLADAIAYMQAAQQAGLDIDDFAGRVAFFFNCHNDFLEEIAKFRAARRIWAKLMKERFLAKNERSLMLRFHTQTAGSSLTAAQPYNNIVRTTIQALAAVLGGSQSLHTNSFDEALGLPSEASATLALRTQQIIAYESGVASVADAFGGSYVVEHLTDKIECEVNKQIEYIDSLGGMLKAIEQGYPQAQIEKSAYQYQRELEAKERIIVGVNDFVASKDETVELQKIDARIEKDQVARLQKFKSNRNDNELKQVMSELAQAAKDERNVMPLIIKAVRTKASLGEIADCMRAVYGEYRSE